jgi:hypothetical protein
MRSIRARVENHNRLLQGSHTDFTEHLEPAGRSVFALNASTTRTSRMGITRRSFASLSQMMTGRLFMTWKVISRSLPLGFTSSRASGCEKATTWDKDAIAAAHSLLGTIHAGVHFPLQSKRYDFPLSHWPAPNRKTTAPVKKAIIVGRIAAWMYWPSFSEIKSDARTIKVGVSFASGAPSFSLVTSKSYSVPALRLAAPIVRPIAWTLGRKYETVRDGEVLPTTAPSQA